MSERFNVSPFTDPRWPDVVRYMVKGTTADGERIRRVYPTKEFAKHQAAKLNAEAARTGALGVLTEAQRLEAEKCFKLLAPLGVSLDEVVVEYATRRRTLDASGTIKAVYDALLEARKDKVGSLYLAQLKGVLAGFATEYADRKLDSFTPDEVGAFIAAHTRRDGSPLSVKSRNNLRGYLMTLWAFAMKKGLAKSNPAKLTDKTKGRAADTAILTPAALREVVAAARRICPKSVAPLVIQAFAGLRSAEVCKLDWGEVNMEDRHITVVSWKAKTATRRNITMSENLWEFLRPLAKASGPVTATCHLDEFPKIRAAVIAAGHEWGNNALRHSFVSYRYAATSDENLTAADAGHTVKMLHAHYKGLVSKKDAAAWWGIWPSDAEGGNVLTLAKPAAVPVGRRRKSAKG